MFLIVRHLSHLFFLVLNQIILELHDLERQMPDLRKKADDERTKKEAVSL
jgi:hypothetical protein